MSHWLRRSRAFRRGESSGRARRLTESWLRLWPDLAPSPRAASPRFASTTGRWVRFHSLPESKRYAESKDEEREVLRRHLVVLNELRAGDQSELLVMAVDYGRRDYFRGWTRALLPGAWPWLKWSWAEDPDDPPSYFWVTSVTSTETLSPLLKAAADDRAGHVTIAPSTLEWLYMPYDGGADVYARTTEERDSLRSAHPGWLSPRPDGL